MKGLTRVLVALLFLHGLSGDFCKRALMEAYFLEGLLTPTQEKHPLCPAIKNNCCTSADIVKIYDKYSNLMVPKLAELKVKFNASLRKLKTLHEEIGRLKPRDNWQGDQKLFCQNSQANFTSFKFNELVEDLARDFLASQDVFAKVHTGTLCVFCDYDAHLEAMLSTQVAGLDSGVCLDVLNQGKAFLIAQNVRLVDYFRRAQTLLDCHFLDDKFNLPFAFGREQMLAEDFTACFEKLTPESLDRKCERLCQELQLGAISPVFEGNYFFILRAIDYLNELLRNINSKNQVTRFDPLAALQKINQAADQLKFFNFGNKKEARRREMEKFKNRFFVGEWENDDKFRNDEMRYPARRDDDTFAQEIENDFQRHENANRWGWDTPYKELGRPPQEGQQGRGTGNFFQDVAQGADNLFKNVAQGATSAVANIGNAVGSVFRGLPRLWMRRLKARGVSAAEFARSVARKLHQQGGGAIPVVNSAGKIVLLRNGDSLPNGLTNVNGALFKNGKRFGVSKAASKKVTKSVKNSQIRADAHSKVQAKQQKKAQKLAQVKEAKKEAVTERIQAKLALKLAKEMAQNEAKRKAAQEQHKLQKIQKKLEKKLGKKLKITVEKPAKSSAKASPPSASAKREANAQSASEVLERDAIKALLGKKNVPKAEQELLEKMAKMIDSQFTDAKKPASKTLESKVAKKVQRHTRLLEALFEEERPERLSRLHGGRRLEELAVDPLLALNPIAYYESYYESMEALQDSNSTEIFKPNAPTIDLVRFERIYVFNQGININAYIPSLAFDMRRQELLQLLHGKANMDKFDSQMDTLIKTCDRMFLINTIKALVTEFTAVVTPERLSDDDKQLARMEPVYDADEDFDVIDRRFFDTAVLTRLEANIPHAYIDRRPKERDLRGLGEGPENESSRVMRELRGSIRPANLVADRRARKEVF